VILLDLSDVRRLDHLADPPASVIPITFIRLTYATCSFVIELLYLASKKILEALLFNYSDAPSLIAGQ
jgi:hypothetical protein